jgi:hypothetical protein
VKRKADGFCMKDFYATESAFLSVCLISKSAEPLPIRKRPGDKETHCAA